MLRNEFNVNKSNLCATVNNTVKHIYQTRTYRGGDKRYRTFSVVQSKWMLIAIVV